MDDCRHLLMWRVEITDLCGAVLFVLPIAWRTQGCWLQLLRVGWSIRPAETEGCWLQYPALDCRCWWQIGRLFVVPFRSHRCGSDYMDPSLPRRTLDGVAWGIWMSLPWCLAHSLIMSEVKIPVSYWPAFHYQSVLGQNPSIKTWSKFSCTRSSFYVIIVVWQNCIRKQWEIHKSLVSMLTFHIKNLCNCFMFCHSQAPHTKLHTK